MFKCIKEVVISNSELNNCEVCFKKGKIYNSYKHRFATGHETRDEGGNEHIIGREGDKWFDEHFKELSIEKLMDQNEKYSQMLELIGWHMDKYINSGLVNEVTTLKNITSVFNDFKMQQKGDEYR